MIQHLNGREVDEIQKTLKSKLSAASGFLECSDRNNTIINLKDEEITVLFWALESFHKEREDREMPLICLRCKKDKPMLLSSMKDKGVTYTHYSYCEDCIRKGLAALRKEDDRPRKKGLERAKEIVDVEAWAYCDYLVRKYKGGSPEAEAASALASTIRERIDEELEQEGRT